MTGITNRTAHGSFPSTPGLSRLLHYLPDHLRVFGAKARRTQPQGAERRVLGQERAGRLEDCSRTVWSSAGTPDIFWHVLVSEV